MIKLNMGLTLREKKIAVVADIGKTFLQINLKELYHHFFIIFMIEDSCFYQHNVQYLHIPVVYFCLNNALEEERLEAEKAMKSFYIDNCIASVDSMLGEKILF